MVEPVCSSLRQTDLDQPTPQETWEYSNSVAMTRELVNGDVSRRYAVSKRYDRTDKVAAPGEFGGACAVDHEP